MFSDFRKPFACEATKIRKGERRGKRKNKFFRFDYPEPHPDSWKDSCFWEIYNMFFGKASYVIFVGCVIFFDELCKGEIKENATSLILELREYKNLIQKENKRKIKSLIMNNENLKIGEDLNLELDREKIIAEFCNAFESYCKNKGIL